MDEEEDQPQEQEEEQESKPEPKIDIAAALFVGVLLLLTDGVDFFFPLAGDVTDVVVGGPLQVFLFLAGVNGAFVLASNIIEAIPILQNIPLVRTLGWIGTIIVDRNPKLQQAAAVAAMAEGKVGGLAEAGEGVAAAEGAIAAEGAVAAEGQAVAGTAAGAEAQVGASAEAAAAQGSGEGLPMTTESAVTEGAESAGGAEPYAEGRSSGGSSGSDEETGSSRAEVERKKQDINEALGVEKPALDKLKEELLDHVAQNPSREQQEQSEDGSRAEEKASGGREISQAPNLQSIDESPHFKNGATPDVYGGRGARGGVTQIDSLSASRARQEDENDSVDKDDGKSIAA